MNVFYKQLKVEMNIFATHDRNAKDHLHIDNGLGLSSNDGGG
jgi:hypothetical protein